jgi:hypothetical protein
VVSGDLPWRERLDEIMVQLNTFFYNSLSHSYCRCMLYARGMTGLIHSIDLTLDVLDQSTAMDNQPDDTYVLIDSNTNMRLLSAHTTVCS